MFVNISKFYLFQNDCEFDIKRTSVKNKIVEKVTFANKYQCITL